MNYRHAFHAGSFADVLKHAVLALLIEHMKLKPAPFCLLDCHAGVGSYDLGGAEALKTLEWRLGIGRLLGPDAAPIPAAAAGVLAPYLDVVRAANASAALETYPGSPAIAQALMRDGDRLLANELHPDDHAALADNFRHDRRVTVSARDGYQVLKALLPPKERRGIVVVDPPFEVSDEFERLAEGLAQAMRRFATGTYLVWYPLKDRAAAAGLLASIAATGVDKTLIAEFYVRAPEAALLFNGCGLLLINPPFTLSQRLDILMPFLTERLAQGPGARYRLAIS